MNSQQEKLCKFLVSRVLLHQKEFYPGYKSEFILTYTEDEKIEMEKIVNEDI